MSLLKKGILITFEGPDGSGKTTQLQRLAASLEQSGYRIITTREPGGTPISDQIRELLLSPDNKAMNAHAEALLMAASRAQHVHELIIPALQDGYIVLCDRFVDASIAYQAAGLGLDETHVQAMNEFAVQGVRPARTYLLDISVEAGRKRMQDRFKSSGVQLDRIEQKDSAYHERVRKAFLRLAKSDPKRICLLQAERSPDDIFADIYADCQRLLRELSVQ